jgi:uncharacterized membrane protein YphA (DoxX/SURF4 family)
MKIAMIIVRTLMGLLFLFASITVLFNLMPPPPPDSLPGNLRVFMEGIKASGYFMTLLKVTELVCGLAFVSGRFVPLATIVIAPIIVNILFVHIFLDTTGLPVGIFLVLANSFVAYYYRKSYAPLFVAK